MIKIFLISIISTILISSINGMNYQNSNELINLLANDNDWEKINHEAGITLFSKQISGHNINAIKITKRVSIPLYIIQNIIMDVDNYDSILSNAEGLITKSQSVSDNQVVAYQFIPVNLPFFDDRHYYFKLKKYDLSYDQEQILVEWNLIDNSLFDKDKNILDAIYLKYGAGVWMAQHSSSGDILLSYRIFMDPSGSIPDFIIDKINQISIVNLFTDVILTSQKRLN